MRKAMAEMITECLWKTHETLPERLRCTYAGDAPLSRGLCANHSQKVKKFINFDLVPPIRVSDHNGLDILNADGTVRMTYTQEQEDLREERRVKMMAKGLLGPAAAHTGRGASLDYSDIDSILGD